MVRPVVLALVLAALACSPGEHAPAPPELKYTAMPGNANLPFSAVVQVGPMLYLSGNSAPTASDAWSRGESGPRRRRPWRTSATWSRRRARGWTGS